YYGGAGEGGDNNDPSFTSSSSSTTSSSAAAAATTTMAPLSTLLSSFSTSPATSSAPSGNYPDSIMVDLYTTTSTSSDKALQDALMALTPSNEDAVKAFSTKKKREPTFGSSRSSRTDLLKGVGSLEDTIESRAVLEVYAASTSAKEKDEGTSVLMGLKDDIAELRKLIEQDIAYGDQQQQQQGILPTAELRTIAKALPPSALSYTRLGPVHEGQSGRRNASHQELAYLNNMNQVELLYSHADPEDNMGKQIDHATRHIAMLASVTKEVESNPEPFDSQMDELANSVLDVDSSVVPPAMSFNTILPRCAALDAYVDAVGDDTINAVTAPPVVYHLLACFFDAPEDSIHEPTVALVEMDARFEGEVVEGRMDPVATVAAAAVSAYVFSTSDITIETFPDATVEPTQAELDAWFYAAGDPLGYVMDADTAAAEMELIDAEAGSDELEAWVMANEELEFAPETTAAELEALFSGSSPSGNVEPTHRELEFAGAAAPLVEPSNEEVEAWFMAAGDPFGNIQAPVAPFVSVAETAYALPTEEELDTWFLAASDPFGNVPSPSPFSTDMTPSTSTVSAEFEALYAQPSGVPSVYGSAAPVDVGVLYGEVEADEEMAEVRVVEEDAARLSEDAARLEVVMHGWEMEKVERREIDRKVVGMVERGVERHVGERDGEVKRDLVDEILVENPKPQARTFVTDLATNVTSTGSVDSAEVITMLLREAAVEECAKEEAGLSTPKMADVNVERKVAVASDGEKKVGYKQSALGGVATDVALEMMLKQAMKILEMRAAEKQRKRLVAKL
ncbi:hypothetical protein BC829DRAFT_388397, partial [Chytridium lagenaria]